MTLLDLKILCVKKTLLGEDEINSTNVEELKNDSTYSSYFNNVLQSINDGIAYLVASEKIQYQDVEVEGSTNGKRYINKSEISATNIYKTKGIIWESDDGEQVKVEYSEYQNKYSFTSTYIGGKFIIVYAPKINLLTDNDDNTDIRDFGIDDLVAHYIVYYVRCELYESIEPDLCVKWRAYAEQYLASMEQSLPEPKQNKVISTYGSFLNR